MVKSETNIQNLVNQPYKYGFSTIIETETLPAGLNEEIIAIISKKKKSPNLCLIFACVPIKSGKK